ncbi:MAG TPA: MBL fold metallo-hydrolase [Bryobacteraceae bacterium]|nr:MBL fold metallo-hydrolase [Bryobacteraceae bacterium]
MNARVFGALVIGPMIALAQPAAPAEIHVLPVQGNVSMLVGAGGNIAVQVGKDGVLLVDTGLAASTDKVLATVKQLSKGTIRYIVNTHFHADHTGGNDKVAAAGSAIVGGNFAGQVGGASGANIVAHENVLNAMGAQKPALPFAAMPTDTYYTNSKDLFFNGEAVQLFHIPNAHTDGDSVVFFRRSDVIVAGDIFTPGNYPIIDLAHGGNVQGVLAGLNRIIDLTVPADKQEGGTYVIPGHGRLCDEADVVEYRDMLTIIRDRVQDSVKKGMTLEQVKASKPTRDYDPLYGATTGFWTTDMFVEAVYKSLAPKGK